MYIDSIEINNFRSIRMAKLAVNSLAVFVGENDAGKSNVLKALNLFFNGEAENGKGFRFMRDFSSFSNTPQKSAKQISIKIKFKVPKTYKGYDYVVWQKSWRNNGLHYEKISDKKGNDFPKKSKIPFWVKQINYKYVPAIKGPAYFSHLLGDLYNVLSRTINNDLKNKSEEFVSYLQEKTSGITDNLKTTLGLDSLINFPEDLYMLFEALDFQTDHEGNRISLNLRGDGIKVRHIPSVLRFIADQENANKSQGDPKVSTIWGYEEPENNLEIGNAFKKSDEFLVYSKSIQILATTHSPAFYQLGQGETQNTVLYFVEKTPTGTEYFADMESSEINKRMGLLGLITPFVREKQKELERINIEMAKLKSSYSIDKPTIFVEGKTDKQYFEKAIEIFFPDSSEQINIVASNCADKLKDNLLSWQLNPEVKYKAYGIFDDDKAGHDSKRKFVDSLSLLKKAQSGTVKATFLTPTSELIDIKSKHVTFGVAIEELFPASAWDHFYDSGWLKDRTDYHNYKEKMPSEVFMKGIPSYLAEKGFLPESDRKVFFAVDDHSKMDIKKYILSLESENLEETLLGLKKTLSEALRHLL